MVKVKTNINSNMNKVYKNYMVDLKVSNKKLKARAINILNEILNIPHDLAEKLLLEANENIKIAIVMYKLTLDVNTAKILLAKHKGNLRKIIE